MPGFNTYDALRLAEDVQDDIYIISPVDNPVASMSRTIRATGKLHEWSQDALPSAGVNAAIEGAAAGNDGSAPVEELDNYCQIMTAVAEVTGTLEEVDKYGRDSEMAYQLELRYGYLANCEELAMVGAPGGTRQTATAGNSGAARKMASIHSQLDTDVVVDADEMTTYAEVETALLDAHQASWEAGGKPDTLMTNGTHARHISSFAYAAGRTRDIRNERSIVNVVDLYVSNYGQLDVILDRYVDDCYLGLDFSFLATPVLRPTHDYAIAKTGDSDKRQIIREATCAVLNTRAHFMVDNVADTLTFEEEVTP